MKPGKVSALASAQTLPPSPKYAAVHINPQAFEKKFIFVGFLS
jgi:hypothetical protein